LRVKSAYTGSKLKQIGHQLLRYANPAHGVAKVIGRCLYQLVVNKVHCAYSVTESRTSVIKAATTRKR
jgi:hypothetical protein